MIVKLQALKDFICWQNVHIDLRIVSFVSSGLFCIADKSWEENTELLFFLQQYNVQQHFERDFDERQLLFVSEIQTYTSESMRAVKYKFAKKIIGNII